MAVGSPFRFGIVPLATAFVVIVCLSILLVDIRRTQQARTIQLQQGETATNNLVRSVAQHATDTLKEADAVVLGLVDHLEADGTGPASVARMQSLMVRFASAMPQLQRLSVIGPDGHWVASSLPAVGPNIDSSDREYFRHHASDPGRDAFIGPLIRNKTTHEWIITLSRRFNWSDGSFGGVVLASIDLDYFRAFYANLEIGKNGAIALASTSGQLFERRPAIGELVGKSVAGTDLYRNYISKVSEGLVLQDSELDHVERQIGFKNLDEYPLYVLASLSTAETLASWKADAIAHTVFILVLATALGFSGFWLVRHIKRSAEMELELRQSKVELEELNQQLGTMAREDGLTGLVNRRELDRVLVEEISRAERARTPLAFILLDVDLFKLFNDRYGHPAGDECLRKIGTVLRNCIHRPGDAAARYGGEEFAVVLPGITTVGALAVAESISRAVRNLRIEHFASDAGVVTISAGVAVLAPDNGPMTVDSLLRSADAALYAAKRGGRDKVQLHQRLAAA